MRRSCRRSSSAARRSTTRGRRGTTTSSRPCTRRSAAPTRTRRSTIWPACSMPARTGSSSPAAWCARRSRISALPTRRRSSIANAAKDAFDFLGSPEGELALAAGGDLSRHSAEIECRLYRLQGGDAGRQGARLPDAAEDDPQRADEADEADRIRRELPLRPRRAGRLFGPGLLARKARPAELLRARRPRLRARGAEAAGMVGAAAAGAARDDANETALYLSSFSAPASAALCGTRSMSAARAPAASHFRGARSR